MAPYGHGRKLAQGELITLPCDVINPAARPHANHVDNAVPIQAKLFLEGENIPVARVTEKLLHDGRILVVPNFIASAGGVICATVEFHGESEAAGFTQISEKSMSQRGASARAQSAQCNRATPRSR